MEGSAGSDPCLRSRNLIGLELLVSQGNDRLETKEKGGAVLRRKKTEVRSWCAGHFTWQVWSPVCQEGLISRRRVTVNTIKKPSCASPSIPGCCWVGCFCFCLFVGILGPYTDFLSASESQLLDLFRCHCSSPPVPFQGSGKPGPSAAKHVLS